MKSLNESRSGYKKTRVGWIPEEWECLPFTSLFDRVSVPVDVDPKNTYREIGIRSHCKGVFLKEETKGKALGNKRVFWCQPGALTFNIVFAWEQAVAILSPETEGLIASHRFPMYRAKNGRALEAFYLWFFRSIRGKHVLGLASPGGAGRNKTLGQGELDFLFVPVPTLREQEDIAKVLSTWDLGIGQLECLIAAKEQRKRALMQQLLTGKRRFAEFGTPTSKHDRMPRGWRVETLKNVAEVTFSGVDKKSHDSETSVSLCNYMDVYTNACITPDLPFMQATASRSEILKYSLQKGDVMITKDSETPDDIGVAAVVTEDLENVLCGYHLALIRPNPNNVDPVFLAKELASTRLARYFCTHANGATRFGLTTSAIMNVPLHLPPLAEQHRIALMLETADAELAQLRARLGTLKQQKKGLMQKLLTGVVRVQTRITGKRQ